ncbi:MAG: hypothetical protein CR997_04210 [Acidobacteria bacterium]|nr:MAG: hypothetical protein CR997_04210 [Acidobacteriota bacterium]
MLKLILGKRGSKLTQEEIKEPFLRRVEHAIQQENYHSAIAFLSSAIELLPEDLSLYFQRGQIYQLGLRNYCSALKDYRFILCFLQHDHSHPLYKECKSAMISMMDDQTAPMKVSRFSI